jgi:hypothetical protein
MMVVGGMRKVLESRNVTDEERMKVLEQQLKEATALAEEADRKCDEVFITLILRMILFWTISNCFLVNYIDCQ